MHISITNNGPAILPIASDKEGGWADGILPGATYSLERAEATLVILGDKPSFIESFKEDAIALVRRIAELIRHFHQRDEYTDATVPQVIVSIENFGPNPIRACLGSNTDETHIAVGVVNLRSPGYLELREMGVGEEMSEPKAQAEPDEDDEETEEEAGAPQETPPEAPQTQPETQPSMTPTEEPAEGEERKEGGTP